MNKFVLYCKSHSGDLGRAYILSESIKKYNRDNIPFYISVPREDIDLFKSIISGVDILCDDDILHSTTLVGLHGWVSQQVVKSLFWKLNLAENYLCLDSDSFFIKDFYLTDFMFDNDTPYTVCHEQKELWNWSVNKAQILGGDPKDRFIQDRTNIMNWFGRSGVILDFGPSPVIWSTKVWKRLELILEQNNMNWIDALNLCSSEFTWYGETLLRTQEIRLVPREPLFKVFHYIQQYQEYKTNRITVDHISQNYLGILLQSSWPQRISQY